MPTTRSACGWMHDSKILFILPKSIVQMPVSAQDSKVKQALGIGVQPLGCQSTQIMIGPGPREQLRLHICWLRIYQKY